MSLFSSVTSAIMQCLCPIGGYAPLLPEDDEKLAASDVQGAKEKSLLRSRGIRQLLNTPGIFIETFCNIKVIGDSGRIYHALSECGCYVFPRRYWSGMYGGADNQNEKLAEANRGLRSASERIFATRFSMLHPDKTAKKEIHFIGSGGCFQALVIITNLAKEGFTNLECTMLDPMYNKDKSSPQELEEFVQVEICPNVRNLKIQIKVKDQFDLHMKELREGTIPMPDAVVAFHIDVNEQAVIPIVLSTLQAQSKAKDSMLLFTKELVASGWRVSRVYCGKASEMPPYEKLPEQSGIYVHKPLTNELVNVYDPTVGQY